VALAGLAVVVAYSIFLRGRMSAKVVVRDESAA